MNGCTVILRLTGRGGFVIQREDSRLRRLSLRFSARLGDSPVDMLWDIDSSGVSVATATFKKSADGIKCLKAQNSDCIKLTKVENCVGIELRYASEIKAIYNDTSANKIYGEIVHSDSSATNN